MTSFSARFLPGSMPDPAGAHRVVQVFAGPDPDHRALAGSLILSPAEADAFLEDVASAERMRERKALLVQVDELARSLPADEVEAYTRQVHERDCAAGCGHSLDGWLGYCRVSLARERLGMVAL